MTRIQNSLFLLCFMILLGFLLVPLCALLVFSLLDREGNFAGMSNFIFYLSQDSLFSTLVNTLLVSATSSAISLCAAFIVAYALLRTNMVAKKLFYIIALLPLFMPNLMYGLGLVYLFGNKGILTTMLSLQDFSIYGFVGIMISESIYLFPQSFLILYLGLQNSDYRLYEQAKIMGISPLKAFLHITLPNMRMPLFSAALVSFILCFSDFGAAVIIGGGYNVLSVEIYKQILGSQNLALGATMSVIILLPSLFAFFLLRWVESKSISVSSRATHYKIDSNKFRDICFFGVSTLILSIILCVIAAVILASVITLYPHDLSLTLKHFSLSSSLDGIATLKNSLLISVLVACLGSTLSFVFGYLLHISKSTIATSFGNFLIILPSALPGLVLGIAYLLFFNGNFLSGTFFILIACNIIHFFSLPTLSVKNALLKIDRELELASRIFGISAFSMFKGVYLPLCLPAILENFMYFFVNSMVSISALIFIYSQQSKVAAISIVHLDERGYIEEAAALAVMIACINIAAKLLFDMLKEKR